MSKAMKVVTASSLLLNVALIVGFLIYKDHVRSRGFEQAIIVAAAEGSLLESILSDLEGDDPARIGPLKARLRKNLQQAKEVEAMWRDAAGLPEGGQRQAVIP